MTKPDYAERLSLLRHEMASQGLDGFLVPMADEYQSEYVPPCAQRIAFLTGFTGSAATLVVLKDRSAFFADGRYTLQALQEVSKDLFAQFDVTEKLPVAWLEENVVAGAKIAYDPWLHSTSGAEGLKKALSKAGANAVPVARNLVDMIWKDRPAPPEAPVFAHEMAYAGKSSADKRQEIASVLKEKKCAAAVIADVSSIAWLLNVRGADVAHTPIMLSRALLKDDATVQWFVDARKVTENLPTHLGDQVSILPPEAFPKALDDLAHAGKPVLVDPSQTPSWITDYLSAAGVKIEQGEDPCSLPRAIKNKTELEGMRAAHLCDGAALTAFLAWLDLHWEKDGLTELEVEHKLESFREANASYRGPSFATISATGEHGAIVHYVVTAESNARLSSGQLYLLDSGGQYPEGTTDVTRTVALGLPLAEARDNFTRVLKGHIALASIRFPEGTTGSELDVLARQYLWSVGRDYDHGTGHGVGSYLSVHEGPQAISKRNKTPLKPGMVLSNEPGFYKEGAYGIRIENMQVIVETAGLALHKRKMLGFETLTLAPIDGRLIDVSLMTEAELAWLNDYHRRVRQELQPIVDKETAQWLETVTQPIER